MTPGGSDIGPKARMLGRYELHAELASGGMGTVFIGRMSGPAGFGRTVAIKRLHPSFAREAEFSARFIDEARLASRVHHPNVIQTYDVVVEDHEIFIVMEYVEGESLAKLLELAPAHRLSPRAACAILENVLIGLHAAHEARDERGQLLEIVHRDVSPQNILVGVDGQARILDFGGAKGLGRSFVTRDGSIRGKFGYMAPELLGGVASRATDVYAAGVVLWECLSGEPFLQGSSEAARFAEALLPRPRRLSHYLPDVPAALDEVLLCALHPDPTCRFVDARAMAIALNNAIPRASTTEVTHLVSSLALAPLARRAELVAAAEGASTRKLRTRSTARESSATTRRTSRKTVSKTRGRLRPKSLWIIGAVVILLCAAVLALALAAGIGQHRPSKRPSSQLGPRPAGR